MTAAGSGAGRAIVSIAVEQLMTCPVLPVSGMAAPGNLQKFVFKNRCSCANNDLNPWVGCKPDDNSTMSETARKRNHGFRNELRATNAGIFGLLEAPSSRGTNSRAGAEKCFTVILYIIRSDQMPPAVDG